MKRPVNTQAFMQQNRELQNDLAAARKHHDIDQQTIAQLNARLRELVAENENLMRERDHQRRVWVVLEQLSGR